MRDNLSRWTGINDVSDNVLLNLEQCWLNAAIFQNDCYTGRFQSMSELKSLQKIACKSRQSQDLVSGSMILATICAITSVKMSSK